MIKSIAIIMIMTLSACGQYSNQEFEIATKQCKDNGGLLGVNHILLDTDVLCVNGAVFSYTVSIKERPAK